jgi:hypothetical protein
MKPFKVRVSYCDGETDINTTCFQKDLNELIYACIGNDGNARFDPLPSTQEIKDEINILANHLLSLRYTMSRLITQPIRIDW